MNTTEKVIEWGWQTFGEHRINFDIAQRLQDCERIAENERLRVAFEEVDAEARYMESMSHDYEQAVHFMDQLWKAVQGDK